MWATVDTITWSLESMCELIGTNQGNFIKVHILINYRQTRSHHTARIGTAEAVGIYTIKSDLVAGKQASHANTEVLCRLSLLSDNSALGQC